MSSGPADPMLLPPPDPAPELPCAVTTTAPVALSILSDLRSCCWRTERENSSQLDGELIFEEDLAEERAFVFVKINSTLRYFRVPLLIAN